MQRDLLQPLPTNVISWYELPFATKLGLLQCFLIVVQGLEVCSVTSGQRYPKGEAREVRPFRDEIDQVLGLDGSATLEI